MTIIRTSQKLSNTNLWILIYQINGGYLNVSVLSEGLFSSNFENRMMPTEIKNSFPFLAKSIPTRQIFVSDGDIIRNETNGIASDSTTLPLGFDRIMNQQFGNKEFIKHAVLYLAGEENWLNLRTRTVKLRLLNKTSVKESQLAIQILVIVLPILLLALFGFFYQWRRKKKYSK
jgi:ABC-2 type transport system permease protein